MIKLFVMRQNPASKNPQRVFSYRQVSDSYQYSTYYLSSIVNTGGAARTTSSGRMHIKSRTEANVYKPSLREPARLSYLCMWRSIPIIRLMWNLILWTNRVRERYIHVSNDFFFSENVWSWYVDLKQLKVRPM